MLSIIITILIVILIYFIFFNKSFDKENFKDVYPFPDYENPSFEKHIKPLFRYVDVNAMRWLLNLYDYNDVKNYAPKIYQKIKSKEMPKDRPWSDDKIKLFKKWMDSGYNK